MTPTVAAAAVSVIRRPHRHIERTLKDWRTYTNGDCSMKDDADHVNEAD